MKISFHDYRGLSNCDMDIENETKNKRAISIQILYIFSACINMKHCVSSPSERLSICFNSILNLKSPDSVHQIRVSECISYITYWHIHRQLI